VIRVWEQKLASSVWVERNLRALMTVRETVHDVANLAPPELLNRWAVYLMKRAGLDRKIRNLSAVRRPVLKGC
jgi:hypothetical protein